MKQQIKNKKLSHQWFLFVVIGLLFYTCNPGQRALEKGTDNFEGGNYDVAIDHYEKAIQEGYSTKEANYQIAESYRLSNRIEEALPYYEAVIEEGVNDSTQGGHDVFFHYAFALKNNGKYQEAANTLQKYINAGPDSLLSHKEHAQKELDNLSSLDDIIADESHYEVTHLESLNTEHPEYSPLYHEGYLYFTSSRGNEDEIYKATGTGFTNIFRIPVPGGENDQIDPSKASTLGEAFTNDEINEGVITFSPDGETMIFARGNSGKRKGTQDVNLYISHFRRGSWTEPQLMSINVGEAWDSTPAFSRNGRVLYFSSNRRGGYGGNDLYMATKDGYGRWGNVKNMGGTINTSGDEMFPFVSDDGKLYFSSSGHPSMGGLDLFVATRDTEGNISIENLGPPMNSVADDFGISFTSIRNGYFSSDRKGGVGNDDIYAFVNNDPDLKVVNYYLAGNTLTPGGENNNNNQYLEGVDVLLVDASGDTLDMMNSGAQSEFEFRVEPGTNYELIGEKDGYFTTRKPFSMVGKTIPQDELTKLETDTTYYTDIVLEQIVIDKAIVLENIYYDFDESYITDEAAEELDKLVNILKDNPSISIELSSHTDSRGSDEYNQKLSQRRAESAVEYIISRGIDEDRITAKGYGESQLLIENAETEEEHEKNRRTEFKVIDVEKEGQASRLEGGN